MPDDRSNDTNPLTLEQLEAEKIQQMHNGPPPPKKTPNYPWPNENEDPGDAMPLSSQMKHELINLGRVVSGLIYLVFVVSVAALIALVFLAILVAGANALMKGVGSELAMTTLLLAILVANAILIALIYWIAKPKWSTNEGSQSNEAAGGPPHTRAT